MATATPLDFTADTPLSSGETRAHVEAIEAELAARPSHNVPPELRQRFVRALGLDDGHRPGATAEDRINALYRARMVAHPEEFTPHSEVQEALAERRRRQVDCEKCGGEGEIDGHDCEACGGSGGFCRTCGEAWRACVGVNACEPPGALWAERRRLGL